MFTANITCISTCVVLADGLLQKPDNSNWEIPTTFNIPSGTRVVAINASTSRHHRAEILGSFNNGQVTDAKWKCQSRVPNKWTLPDFNDSSWPAAKELTTHNTKSIAATAKWITALGISKKVFCRVKLTGSKGKKIEYNQTSLPFSLNFLYKENIFKPFFNVDLLVLSSMSLRGENEM